MTAAVNGKEAPALPVDGGLWTAVRVGPGRSVVVLHYATTAILAEFALGAVGLALLLVAWLVLAAMSARGRRLLRR
jgi:hypothetical protein